MSMFKVGDRVRIRTTSRFHNTNSCDPHNSVVGVIKIVGEGYLPIVVSWDVRRSNSYDEIDLEFAEDDFEGNV